jgi:HPt (histidine-containing phosphotransfer) domain-containing protein
MALATEDEWEKDPELRAMRAEFVASFEGRRQALAAFTPGLGQGGPGDPGYEEALKGVVAIAHKLSGAAETYGFPSLTRASSALEDWYHLSRPTDRDPGSAALFAALLSEMLSRTQERGKDVQELLSDSRFARLLAAGKPAK